MWESISNYNIVEQNKSKGFWAVFYFIVTGNMPTLEKKTNVYCQNNNTITYLKKNKRDVFFHTTAIIAG